MKRQRKPSTEHRSMGSRSKANSARSTCLLAALFVLTLAVTPLMLLAAGQGTGVVSAAPYVATMPGSGPGGSLVFADGVDAVDGNPAVLGLRFRWEVRPISAAVGAENSLFDYPGLNDDYTDATGPSQADLIARIEREGGVFVDAGAAATAGIAVGPLALSVSPVVFGSARLSPGLAQFFIDGNPVGSEYVLDGTSFESLAAASVNLGGGFAVARNLKAGPIRVNLLSLGGAFHYYKGVFLAEGTLNGTLTTNDSGEIKASQPQGEPVGEVYYAGGLPVAVPWPFDFSWFGGTGGALTTMGIQPLPIGSGGTGFGADAGLAAVINDRIRFGAAVRNLGTAITWDNAKRLKVDEVSMVGGPSGPKLQMTPENPVTEERPNYRISIPPELVAGVSATVLPATEVFVEGIKGLGDGFGVSQRLRVRGGVNWTPLNILKIGVTAGYQEGVKDFTAGSWDLAAGAGVTLGILNFHVGASGLGGLTPERWKGARVATSLSLGW